MNIKCTSVIFFLEVTFCNGIKFIPPKKERNMTVRCKQQENANNDANNIKPKITQETLQQVLENYLIGRYSDRNKVNLVSYFNKVVTFGLLYQCNAFFNFVAKYFVFTFGLTNKVI